MINYKNKEGLEWEKEFWLQEHETWNNTIEKMSLQILQMKSMVAREEFHKQQVEEEKEETILEMLAL